MNVSDRGKARPVCPQRMASESPKHEKRLQEGYVLEDNTGRKRISTSVNEDEPEFIAVVLWG